MRSLRPVLTFCALLLPVSALAQQIDLTPEHPAAAVLAGIVVADDAGQWQIQIGQQARDAAVAIAEIAHQQQSVGLDPLQHAVIAQVPLVVQIAGDGEVQIAQSPGYLG